MICRLEVSMLAGRQTIASLGALAAQVQSDHPGMCPREAREAAATVAIARGLSEMAVCGELPSSSAVTADLALEREETAQAITAPPDRAPTVSGRLAGLLIAAASGALVGAVAAVLAGGCA